jgi:hypothetical protein
MMALPKQVEAQLKALEELEKQLAGESNPQDPNPADPPGDPKPADPPADPAPAPDPKPAEPKPAPAEPPVAEETWQQKYKTLKGMYDAEVPRLHAEMRDLKANMESLRKAAETKLAEPVEPAKPTKLVTDEDVAAFGQDLIEVQRKVAREVAMEFKKDIDDLRSENVKLREQLSATGTQVSESTFEQRLHRMVPNFEAVNSDPRWIGWLNEFDPILRGPRKLVAQDAFNRGDVEAVAHYVRLFEAATAPAPSAEPTDKRAEELERQIQPSRSVASAPSPSQKGKTYTDSDIQKMFKKAVDLGAKGRVDDAAKLEAEIDAAYREGRVTA